MKNFILAAMVLGLTIVPGCGRESAVQQTDRNQVRPKEENGMNEQAEAFLAEYQREFAALEMKSNLTWWAAANSGKQEAFDAYAAAELALRKFHSDPKSYQEIQRLRESQDQLEPL